MKTTIAEHVHMNNQVLLLPAINEFLVNFAILNSDQKLSIKQSMLCNLHIGTAN